MYNNRDPDVSDKLINRDCIGIEIEITLFSIPINRPIIFAVS